MALPRFKGGIVSFASALYLILAAGCGPGDRSPEREGPAHVPPTVAPAAPETEVQKPVAPVPVTTHTFPASSDLIPFRESWVFSTILNWRPANGLISELNPPRFSWPYLKDIIAANPEVIPATVFTFQIADNPSFNSPIVEATDIRINFYNAVPALDPGTWYWRVGYGPSPGQEWSPTKEFTITDTAQPWDRTFIHRSVEHLRSLPRPRAGPPGGDWKGLADRIRADPSANQTLNRIMDLAARTAAQPWWNDFPKTDQLGRPPANRNEQLQFITMLKHLSVTAYAWRLTGDTRYARSIEHIVTMAGWPMGGLLSPEATNSAMGGHTKMPSQAAELFAFVYDAFQDVLTADQKRILRNAIEWRLVEMFSHPNSIIWSQENKNMRRFGLAYSGGSHPYQNFTWVVPAILLLAGESTAADQLLPFALHYLTGVTTPDGPDEGYNEGHGYSNEKAETMLRAATLADMLLPELELGRNPAIYGLIDWFAFLFSGNESMPWGDSWLGNARGVGGENLLRLFYLTGSPKAHFLWQERARGRIADNPASMYTRPWFELGLWDHHREKLQNTQGTPPDRKTLFLPEAGWVFTHSQPIGTTADFNEAVGMQFQMRPRGGYGHSYPSDGSFLWHAFGQTLNNGGGWQSWASISFSRNPISHNTLLINGEGHRSINPYQPHKPFAARPLAFVETDEHVYWAADLTEGYRHLGEIERVHRHVLFLDRRWFLIFDDLAVSKDSDPARFSWLFHIPEEVEVILKEEPTLGFAYEIGGVHARVTFAQTPSEAGIENRIAREGYINPITGFDHYPPDRARAASRAIFNTFLSRPSMHNNLWLTSTNPAHEVTFFSVLAAAREAEALPTITFAGDSHVTLALPDGSIRTVSFSAARPADIVIDLPTIRNHARISRPAYFGPSHSASTANADEDDEGF